MRSRTRRTRDHWTRMISLFSRPMDPDLVKRIGAATALEVRATGIPYTFAPCIAVQNESSEFVLMETSLSSLCSSWLPRPRSSPQTPFPSSFIRPFLWSPTLSRLSSSVRCRHLHPPSSSVAMTLADIKNSGIVACLRAESSQLAIEAARAAISGGISVLEIVMSTPGVFEILQQLVREHPTVTLGVGTVLNDKDARKAILSGAKFLMSPAIVKEIMDVVHAGEALYIPGVMTPTEILSAHNMGAKIVKVYPISALGGVQYMSAIRKPFSHIPMVASQGVTIDSLGDYISQGASAVLLSDAIFNKEAMSRNDFNAIYRLAQLAVFEGKKAMERKGTLNCL